MIYQMLDERAQFVLRSGYVTVNILLCRNSFTITHSLKIPKHSRNLFIPKTKTIRIIHRHNLYATNKNPILNIDHMTFLHKRGSRAIFPRHRFDFRVIHQIVRSCDESDGRAN